MLIIYYICIYIYTYITIKKFNFTLINNNYAILMITVIVTNNNIVKLDNSCSE